MCLTKWQAASSHDGAQVVWLGRGGRCWVLLPQAEELAVGVQLDAGLLHGLQSKGQLLQTGAKTVAAMQSESAQKWQSTLPHSQRMAGHRTSLQCPAIGKPLKGKYAFTLRPPTLVGGLQDDIADHRTVRTMCMTRQELLCRPHIPELQRPWWQALTLCQPQTNGGCACPSGKLHPANPCLRCPAGRRPSTHTLAAARSDPPG